MWTSWQYYSYWLSQLTAYFKNLPCTITDGKNKDAKQYNIYGNSKQEYITIDDVQYKIPDGYTLLDSLTATGTQYIDLGLKGSNNTRAVLKLSVISSSTCMMFGSRKAATSNAFAIWAASSTVASQLRIGWDSSSGYVGSIWEVDKEYSFDISADGYYIDGSLIYSPASATFQTPNNLKLFAYDTDGTLTYSAGTFYGVQKIYESNVLVRAVAPMKNSSDVLGMYDFVNSVFYTNAGTGSFTAGSEAPTPSQPVEIQSCGDLAGQKNQLVEVTDYTQTSSGVTMTSSATNCTIAFDGTSESTYNYFYNRGNIPLVNGHTYFTYFKSISGSKTGGLNWHTADWGLSRTLQDGVNNDSALITYSGVTASKTLLFQTHENAVYNNFIFTLEIIDLTQMFGEGNEPTTVADAKAKIAEVMGGEKDYYAYNAGSDYYKIPVIAGSNCGCKIFNGTETDSWTVDSTNQRVYKSVSALGLTDIYYTTAKTYYLTIDGISARVNTNGILLFYLDFETFDITDSDSFNRLLTEYKPALYYQRSTDTSWTAPTTTNIYLDEPLRKVGNYIDKIHFGQGKNLVLDTLYKTGYAISASGIESVNSAFNIHHAYVSSNTQYTYKSIPSISNYTRVHAYDSTGTWISQLYSDSTTVSGVRTATFTTPSNCTEIRMQEPTSETNIQLEQGTTATEYHPYSDTPQVIRNIGNVALDSLTWKYDSSLTMFYSKLPTALYTASAKGSGCLCTSYKDAKGETWSGWANFPDKSIAIGNNFSTSVGENITTKDTDYTDATTFTSSLAGASAIYPLATSTSEVISLPTLTPSEGTTIYTVPTKVQPFVSANLFDKDNAELIGGTLTDTTFTANASAMNIDYQIPAGTYTISCSNSDTIYLRNGKVASGIIAQKTSSESSKTFTFTGNVDGYLRISTFNTGTTVSNIKIQEGSSATTYEPYCNGMELEAYVTGRS